MALPILHCPCYMAGGFLWHWLAALLPVCCLNVCAQSRGHKLLCPLPCHATACRLLSGVVFSSSFSLKKQRSQAAYTGCAAFFYRHRLATYPTCCMLSTTVLLALCILCELEMTMLESPYQVWSWMFHTKHGPYNPILVCYTECTMVIA